VETRVRGFVGRRKHVCAHEPINIPTPTPVRLPCAHTPARTGGNRKVGRAAQLAQRILRVHHHAQHRAQRGPPNRRRGDQGAQRQQRRHDAVDDARQQLVQLVVAQAGRNEE